MFSPRPITQEFSFDVGVSLSAQPDWITEEKVNGKRALAEFGLLRGNSITYEAPIPLPASWSQHVIDGELTNNAYHLFDLLVFRNKDIRNWPLSERRKALRSLSLPTWCRHVANGANTGEFLEAVMRDGGEGVVLKRLSETYYSGAWIKIDGVRTEDAVVVGLHEQERTVTIAQWQGDKLVECGSLVLGSIFEQAWLGQVVEISVDKRHPSGRFTGVNFVRFRPDKLATDCRAR